VTQPNVKPLEVFNAEVIQAPLRGLFMNMDRAIERKLKEAIANRQHEAERHFSLILIMLRITINSYEGMCFILTTEERDPKRKDRFALLLPPANRQIFDLLFSLIYMKDDFPARSLEYELSGYRQLREMYDTLFARYGTLPKWQAYFDDLRDLVQTMEKYLAITPAQKANPENIKRWVGPAKLKGKPSKSKPFLEFLDDWLYREISAQAHLNAAGLAEIAGFVLASLATEEMRERIEKRTILQYIFRQFTRTLICVLAITSEIDSFCQLNHRTALAQLWVLLGGYADEAMEVYKERYQAMLA